MDILWPVTLTHLDFVLIFEKGAENYNYFSTGIKSENNIENKEIEPLSFAKPLKLRFR